jgi:chromatin remodeling complex protein RSC6
MVRTSKSAIEKSTPAPPAPAPAVALEAPAVEVVAPTKKARKTKTVSPAVEAPVLTSESQSVSEVVVNEVVANANEVVVNEASTSVETPIDVPPLALKLGEFGSKLQQIVSLLSAAKSDYKCLEKFIAKTEKLALKNSHKKRKTSGNRAPSGFQKPTLITEELASFIGVSDGAKLARTQVSKEIHRYIRENNLKDKDNGRLIVPDEKLKTLLRYTDSEGDKQPLSYFNIQRYLKHHFIKETETETSVVA